MQRWLETFLETHGGRAGTVHVLDPKIDQLTLSAAVGIPEAVQEVTRHIPFGKGMAGLAWERGEAVQTCNLQEDETGNVKPGARAVDAKAAIAIPVLDSEGKTRAVVGIAFDQEGDLTDPQVAGLTSAAAGLPN